MSKRERDYDRDYRYDSGSNNSNDAAERRRKRKSRWGGDEKEKIFIPGMPTIIPSNLTKQQEEIYILQLQIESITRRLLTGDLGIPDNPEERSPSPEPIYNSEGKRLNTREYRTKKKFEDERHQLIQKMLAINPSYKPPADYKPPQTKICEKVLIPQEEYPDINFVGLIIGPRGNTLKGMERDSGAKIIIRGKGSVKEGKLARKDGQPLPGEDEPLHAFVTGPTQDSVVQAVAKINEVIRKGIELPENQNDLRRSQLRELALLNGTLRENDGPRCSNCGSNTHRSWQCPDKPNVTNNVFCTNCHGVGHIAKDCKEKRNDGGSVNNAKIDEEYLSLMAELGEAPPPPPPRSRGHHHHHEPLNIPPPPPPPPPQPSSSKSNYMDSNSNSNSAQANEQQQQQETHAAWNNGADAMATAAASAANGADAWAGYMPTAGYDPYTAAYMWNQTAWGAAVPQPASSGKDSTNGVAAATAYASVSAYDQAAQWSQYAAWYAAQAAATAGNGVGATTGSASSAASTIPPPPPPPPPSH